MGDAAVVVVVCAVGSMQFTKSYVVEVLCAEVGAGGLRSCALVLLSVLENELTLDRVEPSLASFRGAVLGLSSTSSL